MIRMRFTVHFRDGTTADVDADQYSISVWERWAAKNGLRPSITDPAPLAWTQMRVMAWAALQRDTAQKITFDVWDATVTEVETVGEIKDADPTVPAMSAG